MNQQDFFIKWRNKFCDFDGAYGSQCVDIIKQFFVEVLNRTPVSGNAIDYWNNPPENFYKYAKTLFNHPEVGDLIVWNTNVSPFGHIGVCNWYRWFDLNCFEQNDPIGSPCQFKTYSYRNILGWLRPISNAHLDVKIAQIGEYLPQAQEFRANVSNYSKNKITLVLEAYNAPISSPIGMITQEQAYSIVDNINPKEKFVMIFYPPNPTSSFYATYYYPKRNCMITTCPGIDPRSLTFELAHQLQTWYNSNRGSNPYIEVVDSNFPSDELITSKLRSIEPYYYILK